MSEIFEKEVRVTTAILWIVLSAFGGLTGGGFIVSDAFATESQLDKQEVRIENLDGRIQALERTATRTETLIETIQRDVAAVRKAVEK
jgi:hypothetical protein